MPLMCYMVAPNQDMRKAYSLSTYIMRIIRQKQGKRTVIVLSAGNLWMEANISGKDVQLLMVCLQMITSLWNLMGLLNDRYEGMAIGYHFAHSGSDTNATCLQFSYNVVGL